MPRRPRTWTPEEDALLAVLPDEEVAARLGIHPVTVRLRRRAVGGAAYARRGRKSDSSRPPKHGAARDVVREQARRRVEQQLLAAERIIRRLPETLGRLHPEDRAALRARASAVVAAAKVLTRRPPRYVWTADDDALLGVLSDHALAEKLGVDPSTVCRRRQEREILRHAPPIRPRPTCQGPECEREAQVRGYCQSHYGQLRRGAPLAPIHRRRGDRTAK